MNNRMTSQNVKTAISLILAGILITQSILFGNVQEIEGEPNAEQIVTDVTVSGQLSGDEEYQISGTVRDHDNKKIEGIVVTLEDKNKTKVASDKTGKNGNYKIEAKAGKYKLVFSDPRIEQKNEYRPAYCQKETAITVTGDRVCDAMLDYSYTLKVKKSGNGAGSVTVLQDCEEVQSHTGNGYDYYFVQEGKNVTINAYPDGLQNRINEKTEETMIVDYNGDRGYYNLASVSKNDVNKEYDIVFDQSEYILVKYDGKEIYYNRAHQGGRAVVSANDAKSFSIETENGYYWDGLYVGDSVENTKKSDQGSYSFSGNQPFSVKATIKGDSNPIVEFSVSDNSIYRNDGDGKNPIIYTNNDKNIEITIYAGTSGFARATYDLNQ